MMENLCLSINLEVIDVSGSILEKWNRKIIIKRFVPQISFAFDLSLFTAMASLKHNISLKYVPLPDTASG